MNTRLKKNLTRGLAATFILMMGGLVVKAAADGPYTAPLEKDKKNAERTAMPRTGGDDHMISSVSGWVEVKGSSVPLAASTPESSAPASPALLPGCAQSLERLLGSGTTIMRK